MVVKFIPVLFFCLNLALNLRCLLFLSLILLDGSVKGLLDLLSSRCKVNMAQLWQSAFSAGTSAFSAASDLSLDSRYPVYNLGPGGGRWGSRS